MIKMPNRKNSSTQWRDKNIKKRIVITKDEFERGVGRDTFETSANILTGYLRE